MAVVDDDGENGDAAEAVELRNVGWEPSGAFNRGWGSRLQETRLRYLRWSVCRERRKPGRLGRFAIPFQTGSRRFLCGAK